MTTIMLPSDSESRNKIKNSISEISVSLSRIESERIHINEILKDIEEEFELPKKEMRKVAKIYHKQNLNEVVDEAETIEETYKQIMGL